MNFALTALGQDMFPPKRYENFLCKLRLNNTYNQLWIHENWSNSYSRMIWLVVRRSLVASEQETRFHFHPWQIRQKSYDYCLRQVIILNLGIVTTQHISYFCRRFFQIYDVYRITLKFALLLSYMLASVLSWVPNFEPCTASIVSIVQHIGLF